MNFPILVSLEGSAMGTHCPTQGWLEEMNSQIHVGLDVLGVGMHCLEEENDVTWYEE